MPARTPSISRPASQPDSTRRAASAASPALTSEQIGHVGIGMQSAHRCRGDRFDQTSDSLERLVSESHFRDDLNRRRSVAQGGRGRTLDSGATD